MFANRSLMLVLLAGVVVIGWAVAAVTQRRRRRARLCAQFAAAVRMHVDERCSEGALAQAIEEERLGSALLALDDVAARVEAQGFSSDYDDEELHSAMERVLERMVGVVMAALENPDLDALLRLRWLLRTRADMKAIDTFTRFSDEVWFDWRWREDRILLRAAPETKLVVDTSAAEPRGRDRRMPWQHPGSGARDLSGAGSPPPPNTP